MLTDWLKKNNLEDYDFKFDLFPKCEDREFWDNKKINFIINKANEKISYNWPIIKASSFMEYKKSGNRTVMESVYRERRNTIILFVLAELMVNDGRYMEQIVDGIFTICEETYWGVSAHWSSLGLKNIPNPKDPTIDLYAAETGSLMSLIYYLLYNKLNEYCPEILDRIEYEINRRIINQYLIHIEYWWQGYYRNINNWNPWIISNIFSTALMILKDKTVFIKLLKKMMTEIDFYYKGLPDDGGCNEGPGYFARAGASFGEFLYLLKCSSNNKINFFDDKKVINIFLYPLEMYIGKGQFVNFSDGTPYGCKNDFTIIYILGNEINDKNIMQLSKELYELKKEDYIHQDLRRILFDLLFEDDIKSVELSGFDKKSYYLKDTQVLTNRKGQWFLGIKGGHNNECHNHNDVGSYVLSYNEDLVLIDCGVGEYRRQTFSEERYTIWTMQSSYHNLPDINGQAQKAGEEFRATTFNFSNDLLEIQLEKAYPKEANLISFKRNAKLDDNSFAIDDYFEFNDENNSVIEHIMTKYKPIIQDNATIVIGDFIIHCDECDISYDGVNLENDRVLYGNWKQSELYRINCKTNNNHFSYRIERSR